MAASRFDTFLFDLDGTLLDSIDLILRCYRHSAETHLTDLPPDRVWRDGLGTPLREQFRAVTEDDALIEAMVVTYREFHHQHHDNSVRLYPRIEPMITTLSERGAALGIVTSKLRRGAERGLNLTGVLERFDIVVTADEVSRPKPHPEPVETALSRMNADPERTIFIGDSPHDMASGRAAGVSTGAVLWGPFAIADLEPTSPTLFLEKPQEILSL